jgi:hypothetical protein
VGAPPVLPPGVASKHDEHQVGEGDGAVNTLQLAHQQMVGGIRKYTCRHMAQLTCCMHATMHLLCLHMAYCMLALSLTCIVCQLSGLILPLLLDG